LSTATKIGALVLGVALLQAAAPEEASAQQRSIFSVDGRIGAAFPAGELSNFEKTGLSWGAGVGFWLTSVVGLRGDLQYDYLVSKSFPTGASAPDLDLRHLSGSLVFNFAKPQWQTLPLSFTADIGAGVTKWKTPDGSTIAYDKSYFTGNAGAAIGYDATRNINLFIGAKAYLMVLDEDDTQVWADLDPKVSTFTTSWSFPLFFGVKISLP
jgi:hypothetical protein